MKYFKNTILILLAIINNCYSQTIIVDYNLMFGDFSKIDSINKNFQELDNGIKFNFNNIISYKLVHSQQKSIFKSYDNSNIFSTAEESADLAFLNNFKLNDFSSVVFKDFKLKKSSQREFIVDKSFLINDSLSKYNWVLMNENRTIGGLQCSGATTKDHFGKTITAWFTVSIPFSNGPGDFHGLPGLIVVIENDDYIFELSKFKIIKDNAEIEFTETGKIVPMSEFIKIFNEKMKNFR